MKLYFKLSKLINYVFGLWIAIILIGAIRSDNLNITNLSKINFLLILGISTILYLLCKNRFINNLYKFAIRYKKIIILIFLIVIFIYQLTLIVFMHFPVAHDVSAIYVYLFYPKNNIAEYFSINPNNLFCLFFLHYITKIFHISPTWFNLDIINLILVDVSAVINVLIIKKINNNWVYKSLVINGIWLMFFPQIIIPYTDTLSLPFVSLYIYFFVCLSVSSDKKLVNGVLCTIFVTLSYLMKPSSILPLIAALILFSIKIDKKRLKPIISMVICISLFLISVIGFKQFTLNQNFINVDYSKAKPMVHFINMGLHDETNGGFNHKVNYEMLIQPTQSEKIKYSINGIKNQLKTKGLLGEIRSLINKNFYNTEDGSFAWIKEGAGTFIVWDYTFENIKGFVTKITDFLKELYSTTGKYINDYLFWSQIMWILLLLLMLKTCFLKEQDFYVSFCQFGLISGLAFLLVFEGGRSRYLIQFLPIMLMLASIGSNKFKFGNLIRVTKDNEK